MVSGTMTIMGLYQWDNTLFELLNLPEGMDKNVLVNMILSELSGLEVLYPNPTVMKNLICLWSASSQYTWETLYKTTVQDYDPIANYDRTETRSLASMASGSSADGGPDTNTNTHTGTDTTTTSGTQTTAVAGFDNSAQAPYTDKDRETASGSSATTFGDTQTNTTQYGHTNSNTYNKSDSETIRAKGNIGVTTTQQMLEQERQIALFNIYDKIVQDFKERYCILVY